MAGAHEDWRWIVRDVLGNEDLDLSSLWARSDTCSASFSSSSSRSFSSFSQPQVSSTGKKLIFKSDLHDHQDKRKAMKRVAALPGIDEITIDLKGKKLTIIGTVDPVDVVRKLHKFWPTDIISYGPAKEPEKKEEAKKEEPKKEEAKKEEGKEEPKKEEAKKEEPKKEEPQKEEPKKEEPQKEEEKKAPEPAPVQVPVVGSAMPYLPYYPPMQTYYYRNYSMEEDPNACVIC